jgi:uncharacterized protein (DUF488 family)
MNALFTVGHSTRTAGEFLALLRAAGVSELVDVRRYPSSKRFPHFAREPLSLALRDAGLGYTHEPDLGGRREPRPDSPNTFWREDAFRGYADHMATPPFAAALARVLERACTCRVAVMCAEALPSRCHRQLIADAAVARGWAVTHLLGPGRSEPHALHPAARPDAGGGLQYPSPGQTRLFSTSSALRRPSPTRPRGRG